MDIAVLAGSVSTVLFVSSYLPMLLKAFRTRDLDSYSRGNLVLATIGNAIYSLYVFSLPVGPIWFLHVFYVIATLLMLVWHVRHAAPDHPGSPLPSVGEGADRAVTSKPPITRPSRRLPSGRVGTSSHA